MRKPGMKLSLLLLLGISFGLGYILADLCKNFELAGQEQKPVIKVEEQEQKVDENTRIVYEIIYLRSNKTITKEFPQARDLLGRSLKEISKQFTSEDGYKITMNKNTLNICQSVDDWTSEDKEKCRLKKYQGFLAIYQGPDDRLLRVTEIQFESLPADIKNAIDQGLYEFYDEQTLNDALENLDEYS